MSLDLKGYSVSYLKNEVKKIGIGRFMPSYIKDNFFTVEEKWLKPTVIKSEEKKTAIVSNNYLIKYDFSFQKFVDKHFKTEKDYRLDLNLWETKYTAFNWLSIYKYCIMRHGKRTVFYSLFKRNPSQARYLPRPIPETKIYIGRKELQEKYNGNKWLVPVNRFYDETIE